MSLMIAQVSQPVLQQIAVVVVPLGILFVITTIAWKLWKRNKGHPFPDRKTVDAVFREDKASGRSFKSSFTRIGGANNSLVVIVTNEELWVTLQDWLGWLAKDIDLDHRILLSSISRVEMKEKMLVLTFVDDQNETKMIELKLRNTEQFLEAIGKAV